MSRKILAILTLVVLLALTVMAHAEEQFSMHEAASEYKASLNRSAKLANKALPLIAEIDSINTQTAKLGMTPKDYLSPGDYKKFQKLQAELHQLFALQNVENSLTRDLMTLERLYAATMLYHRTRAEYAIKRGTGNGFDDWLGKQEIDSRTEFHLKLLNYIHELIPLSENQRPSP